MKKGFTLIELLVVIAIIGILSSVVLIGIKEVGSKNQNKEQNIELSEQEINNLFNK